MKCSANHADSSIDFCGCSQLNRSVRKPTSLVAKLSTFASNQWQYLWSYFNQRLEPRVWQKRDRYGNLYWVIYDPTTGYSSSFSSEKEVRVWLEQRYYRS